MKSLLWLALVVAVIFGVSHLIEGTRPDEEAAARPAPLHADGREMRTPGAMPLDETDDAFYQAARDRLAAEAAAEAEAARLRDEGR